MVGLLDPTAGVCCASDLSHNPSRASPQVSFYSAWVGFTQGFQFIFLCCILYVRSALLENGCMMDGPQMHQTVPVVSRSFSK